MRDLDASYNLATLKLAEILWISFGIRDAIKKMLHRSRPVWAKSFGS